MGNDLVQEEPGAIARGVLGHLLKSKIDLFLQNKNHYAVSTLKMLFIVKKKLNFFGIFLSNSLPSPPWKKMRLHPVMGVGATATSEV